MTRVFGLAIVALAGMIRNASMRTVFAFLRSLSGNGRRSGWVTGSVLAGLLALGAWQRFSWPQYPLADADTWGYLHPALAKLCGGAFAHTDGRNFVYPAWVYLWLRASGDFRAVSVAQHLLGLAAGALLWACWRQWRAWRPADSRLPAWVEAGLGLGLVAFFLLSPSVILYEHQLRPEAVFPFFAVLDGWLLLGFGRAWFVDRRPGAGAAWAAAAWLVGVLLYQLKPSFGLTVLVVAAPLVAGWVFAPGGGQAADREQGQGQDQGQGQEQGQRQSGRRRAWRARRALGGALLAASLLAVGVFLLPERRLAQDDPLATLFLPETLLTIHADLIRDQMRADLASHASTPFPAPWLASTYTVLDADLAQASLPEQRPYRSLGFNPDFLMYAKDSFCSALLAAQEPDPARVAALSPHHRPTARYTRDPAQVAAFAFYYYRRVWERQPGRMLGKIVRQLQVFYRLDCPAFPLESKLNLATHYAGSINALNYPSHKALMESYPPGRAYLAAIERLANSPQVRRMSPAMVRFTVWTARSYVPLLGLFLVGLGVAALARVGLIPVPGMAPLLAPGLLVLMIYGFNFGNCLTIAIVHSLDIGRYSHSQFIFCALAELCALAWLLEPGLRGVVWTGQSARRIVTGFAGRVAAELTSRPSHWWGARWAARLLRRAVGRRLFVQRGARAPLHWLGTMAAVSLLAAVTLGASAVHHRAHARHRYVVHRNRLVVTGVLSSVAVAMGAAGVVLEARRRRRQRIFLLTPSR